MQYIRSMSPTKSLHITIVFADHISPQMGLITNYPSKSLAKAINASGSNKIAIDSMDN